MPTPRTPSLWGALLLTLAGTLAGCAVTNSPAAPAPPPPAPARLLFAGESVRAAWPPAWQQPQAAWTVSGRLAVFTGTPGRVLYTATMRDKPPGIPAVGLLLLDDPQQRITTPPGQEAFVTLTGAFRPGSGTDGWLGTLTVDTVQPLAVDPAGVAAAADAAIRAAAAPLAAAPYALLALPAFATPTAGWQPRPADFTGGGSQFFGLTPAGTPITLWHGAALPAHPDRPLVTRWPAVYVRLDTPPTLLVTIEGQVTE